MASLMSTAHIATSQDIEGTRTYQAARAGIEWGLYQLDPNATAAAMPGCFAATTLNQIPNYTVNVTCTPFPGPAAFYQEGSRQVRMFEITATATPVTPRAPGVERVVSVIAEKCRDPVLVTVAPWDC
jgi:MSHA biogenesis protein MshP